MVHDTGLIRHYFIGFEREAVMAFDFPSSPTNGQEYTSGGATYVWNGYSWAVKSEDVPPPPSVTIADAPPTPAKHGDVWWESDSGLLYIHYDDGNSKQWVPAVPMQEKGATGPMGPPGQWTQMTQAQYNAITPNPNTLYIIVG